MKLSFPTRNPTKKPKGKLSREQVQSMKDLIRSLRGSLKPRPGKPSAYDILMAERRNERHL